MGRRLDISPTRVRQIANGFEPEPDPNPYADRHRELNQILDAIYGTAPAPAPTPKPYSAGDRALDRILDFIYGRPRPPARAPTSNRDLYNNLRDPYNNLGPKPRPPPPIYLWQCKGCGKQETRAGKRRARRAFCTNCRPKIGSIGLLAYRMRDKTQKPWAEIAATVRSRNTASCRRQARRYAERNGLPWPIKP